MNKNLHILIGLGLVLLVGTIGYLATIGVRFSSDLVDAEQAESMAEQTELNNRRMQDTIAEQIADQPVSEQQARLDSPTGQAMSRNCFEWTDFHDNHPSDDARSHRDKACDEYRRYVETGQLPEN